MDGAAYFTCLLSLLWACGGGDAKPAGGNGVSGSAGQAAGGAAAQGLGGAQSVAGGGGLPTQAGGGATNAGNAGASQAPELDPAGDDDGDGLKNGDERALSLDPQSWDSDDDGFADPDEVGDVANPKDTDGDGIIDALESDLTDNDLDAVYDTTDPASGWQVAAGRFYPHAIANDGKDSARAEVVVTGTGVKRVTLRSPANFHDQSVLPNELAVDGKLLGNDALELFDDGTHGDRFAGDGIWSRGGITTRAAIRSTTGERDWVVFLAISVTDAQGEEERYLGIRAPDAGAGLVLQRSQGFYLGVIDRASVVEATALGPTLQKTPHLLNIVDAKTAVALKRRFIDEGAGSDPTVPDLFRPVLEQIPGDVDFVVVFPESRARGRLAGEHVRASVDADGIGLETYAPGPGWGSEADLVRGGIILDYSLFTPLNHELMHQWGVYLGPDLDLGDGTGHWGIAGTYGVLGGFDPKTFVDNPDGTYSIGYVSSDWRTTPLSPIELYLAGLAPASEVAPIITMRDAVAITATATAATVTGTKKTTTIEQIVARHGARAPAYPDAQNAFDLAFAVYSERLLSSVEMSWLDVYAESFGREVLPGSMSFYEATGGRATVKSRLPKLVSE